MRSDVGQHEELRVFHVARQQVEPFVGQLDAVVFLIDDKIEIVRYKVHVAHVVLHVKLFGLEHAGFHALFAQEFDERLVFGQSLERAIEQERSFFVYLLVVACHLRFGFSEELRTQVLLGVDNGFYLRAVFVEELFFAFGHGTGDNQRCTRVVDQYRVYLVDNRVVMFALYEVLRADGHVVAQVIEAEFVVRPECDVGQISLAPAVGVRLVLVNAIDRQPVKHVKRSHPLRVTLREVVVDRHHMYAFAGKGVEKDGQCSYERLSFTGSHFGNLSFVQHDTAEELDVVVHHVPFHLVASGYPMVLIDRLVAFDAYEVMAGRQVTIEIRRCDRNLFVLHETTRRILDDGKGFGQHLFQHFFILIGNLLFDFIYFRPDRFAFFQFFFVDSLTQFFDAFFLFAHVIPYALADVCRTGAQFIVRERFNGRVSRLDLIYVRRNFF